MKIFILYRISHNDHGDEDIDYILGAFTSFEKAMESTGLEYYDDFRFKGYRTEECLLNT